MSDEDLMFQFQKGSREAFEELFQRYRDPLYGFFRRRIWDAARAQDLTQETFLAIIRGAGRYEPRAPFRTYLYGIAMMMTYNERRKHTHDVLDFETSGSRSDDDVLWVRQALQRLDEQDREIVMLREYEQLSYEEIAALLNVPVNTVRSRLFRARMALKNHLKPVEAA